MFLVIENSTYCFLFNDPSIGDFAGTVQSDIALSFHGVENPIDLHRWPDGWTRPQVCVGQSPTNELEYCLFRTPAACESAGFQLVGNQYRIEDSFADCSV